MSRSIADTAICGKPLSGSMGTESFNVSVLLGNGDGTFQAARNFGAGFDPTSVAVGDFNADGLSDLMADDHDRPSGNRLSRPAQSEWR
jgi:hypothetical protein